MRTKKHREAAAKSETPIRIYCDGAGARPDGKGSGFAWIQEGTENRHVYREDGLTNNEAEYLGLRSVLESLPVGSSAEVLLDSMLVCYQFSGRYRVRDTRMSHLLDEVRALIDQKRLTVKVTWIPRQQNLAGRLL